MTQGSAGEAGKGSEAGRKAVRVSLTFQDFRSFITQYDSHISMGGMFIGTRSPLPPGTSCKLDVKLKDGYQLIQGLGEVAWTRDRAQGPDRPPGMGVRFRELEESSRDLIFEIVDRRLVEGSGVFELDAAGEPRPQDIPDLEEILRRAERRREEARLAEGELTDEASALPFSEGGLSEEDLLSRDLSRDLPVQEGDSTDPEPALPIFPGLPGAESQETESFESEVPEESEAPQAEVPESEALEPWPVDTLAAEAVAEEAVAVEAGPAESDSAAEMSLSEAGSGEIAAEELAPELATGALFGEDLEWLKEDFENQAEESSDGEADPEPPTSEQALRNLDDLLKETAPPEAPTTGEIETLTLGDELESDPLSSPELREVLGAGKSVLGKSALGVTLSSDPLAGPESRSQESLPLESPTPEPGFSERPSQELAPQGEARQGETDLFSEDLSDLLAGSAEQPALPSEVLAAGLPDSALHDDQTVTLAAMEETNRLPIDDLMSEVSAEVSSEPPSASDLAFDPSPAPAPVAEAEPAAPASPALSADSSYYYGEKKASRRPFLFILLGLLAAAAVGFFYLRGGLGLGSDSATSPSSVAEDRGPGAAVEQPASETSPVEVQVPAQDPAADPAASESQAEQADLSPSDLSPSDSSPSDSSPAAPSLGASDSASVDSVASGSVASEPAAAAPAASADPMTSVVGITARKVPEGTLITVTADGAVVTGRYRYAQIGSGSPRLLLRMLGVQKGSHPDALTVGTDQVQRIRTGYHPASTNQDLHIVLDLASPAVVVDRVEARGNQLLIWAEGASR